MMNPLVSAEVVRERLTTDFARAAFDKINVLGPRWFIMRDDAGEENIAPSILVLNSLSNTWSNLGATYGASADEIIVNEYNTLIALASGPGAVVDVADSGRESDHRQFVYDSAAETFRPR